MFKHILMPTDGSDASRGAIRDCIAFAKDAGAEVSGLHVMPEYPVYAYEAEMLMDTRQQYTAQCVELANAYLAEIKAAADQAGVKCSTFYVTGDSPYEAIVKASEDRHCDLIAMASHGRKGVQGFLLGSETQKVLTHSRLPVLVFR